MNIKRACNDTVTTAVYNNLFTTRSSPVDQARLKAVVDHTPAIDFMIHLSLPLAYTYQSKSYVWLLAFV